ncbi:MAG: PAS domain S-box protein [Anaeromyxobacter sp.]
MDSQPGWRTESGAEPDALIARFDRQLRHLSVNAAAARLAGLPAGQVLGRTHRDLGLDPALVGAWERQLTRAFDRAAPAGFEFDTGQGAARRHFEATLVPESGADGRVLSVLAFTRDVTARIQAQRALRRAVEGYRTLAENAPEVIARFDRRLRHTYVNGYGAQVYGVPAREVVGKTNAELGMPPEKVAFWKGHFEAVFATGEQRTVEFEFESPAFGRQAFSSLFVPERDESGQVASILAITRDVSQQKRAEEAIRRAEEDARAHAAQLEAILADRRRGEEALRASEERYRNLFSSMTEGFAIGEPILDEAGTLRDIRFVEMNAAFERQSGLEVERARGRPLREVLPGLEPAWVEIYGAVALSGKPVRFENYNRDLDRHFDVYSYQPAPGQFAIIFTDITRRKRAEEASAREKELLARLVDRLPVMITMYHPALGGFRFNEEFKRVLGWTEADAAAGDLMLRAYPDPEVRANAVEHMTSLAPGWREFPVVARGGNVVPSTWANLRLSDDTQVGIGIDLSERKRAEQARQQAEEALRETNEALRASEERWNAAIENFAEGAILATEDEQVIYWNPAARAMHGLRSEREGIEPLERLRGTFELWTPDGTRQLEVGEWPIRRIKRGEAVRGLELRIRRPDQGWERFISYSGALVRTASGQRLIFLSATDLTEQRRAELALREADRRKDEFLGMLSHELRNPLAPIRNALHILDHAEASGPQAARARQIAGRQLAHLTRLVDDLLDVTRIARGRIELRSAALDLAALARRAAEDHRPLMRERHLELAVALPARRVPVYGDETRLAQVLGNLLHNAAKFTPAGGRVTVTVEEQEPSAVVRVADTGAGIDREMMPSIFEPFTQAKQTLARSEGGLGLGLALVRSLVALHGGEVSAVSEGPGHGTEFVLRFPLAGVERAPSSAAAAPVIPAAAGRRRVLVIDDNHDAADSLAQLVSMMGHDVEVAYDAFDGLARVAEALPDVVLCDIGLPGMDGYEFARQCRGVAGHRKLRLVAVSGYAHPDDVASAFAAGFDVHVAKPPDPERIELVLGQAA